tara:strand:- start:373 stop:570 length:198 start_codon:yes stop_codon:yes gene_type:complete
MIKTTEESLKKIKAYNKALEMMSTSTTKHHQEASYKYIERFGNIFFDESLTEQLLEIANSKFYGC